MNGYLMMAEGMRKRNGDKRQIEALEFIGHADTETIQFMYDTGCFNSFTKAYTKAALVNYGLDSDTIAEILGEIGRLHDEVSAGQIITED